ERRLLEDTEALAEPARVKPARALLLAFAVAVPLLAAGAYYYLGGWTDWRVQMLLEQSEREFQAGADNRGTLEALRTALQQRLAQREDKDGRRRFMLARIDIESGRYREAAEQFSLLRKQFPEDASIAAQYAQALYLATDRTLSSEVLTSARRALELDPNQSTALGLMGIAALETKDYAQALLHWRHLLRQLPPSSNQAAMIQEGIHRAEQALGSAGLPGPKLLVSVSIAPALASTMPSGGTLFVFAKAVNGPPMPLAVARLDPAGPPLQVTLDDSMAMAAGLNQSGEKQGQVFARITASGQVRAEAGDVEGETAPIDLGDKAVPVAVVIDRRL